MNVNWKRIRTVAAALSLTAANSFAQQADGMEAGGHAVASWINRGGIYFWGIAIMFTALMSYFDHHNIKWLVTAVIGMVLFFGAVPFVQMVAGLFPAV